MVAEDFKSPQQNPLPIPIIGDNITQLAIKVLVS